jgi:hypothetical protein
MPLRDVPRTLGRLAVRAFAALSAFVLLYVGYGHVASLVSMREYGMATYEIDLGSTASLSHFTASEGGGLTHRFEAGALRIEGAARPEGKAFSRYVGIEQRLDDAVHTRVRFRVVRRGAFDVYVGVARADQPNDDGRRIVAVAHVSPDAPTTFAIVGDVWANGPRHVVATRSPVPPAPVDDAGADADADAAAPAVSDVADGRWHEISLELAAYIHALYAYADGVPTGTEQSKWFMGEKVRLVFGVEAREPGTPVAVDLETAAYESHDRIPKLASFDEKFTGKLIDPRRWAPMMPDGEHAESTALIENGLHVHASSKGDPSFQPGMVLLSQATPLDTFRLDVRLDVRDMHRSSFVVGVIGSGVTPPRFVDLALHADDRGAPKKVIAVGHWTGDGQLTTRILKDGGIPPSITLSLAYDVTTGELSTWLDETRLLITKFDLLPGDTTQLRVGVDLAGADAVADVVIREVKFTR